MKAAPLSSWLTPFFDQTTSKTPIIQAAFTKDTPCISLTGRFQRLVFSPINAIMLKRARFFRFVAYVYFKAFPFCLAYVVDPLQAFSM